MKCIRCHYEQDSTICHRCMSSWLDMRVIAYDTLTNKYGTFSQDNDKIFKKEMKRLDNVWRQNKKQFVTEIDNLNKK